LETKSQIESTVSSLKKGLCLIVVDRTINGLSELNVPIRAFTRNKFNLILSHLTQAETAKVVNANIDEYHYSVDDLSKDIFIKSNGLLKDIEYCIHKIFLANT